MLRFSVPARSAFALGSLLVLVLLIARALGLRPDDRAALLVVFSCTLTYYFYLRRFFQKINPKKVIPSHVKFALDTMVEGLLILDADGNVMLANSAFAKTVGKDSDKLLGRDVDELAWERHQKDDVPEDLPWRVTLGEGTACLSRIVHFYKEPSERTTFLVNSTPIHDQAEECQGALVSFDDITELERNKRELARNPGRPQAIQRGNPQDKTGNSNCWPHAIL